MTEMLSKFVAYVRDLGVDPQDIGGSQVYDSLRQHHSTPQSLPRPTKRHQVNKSPSPSPLNLIRRFCRHEPDPASYHVIFPDGHLPSTAHYHVISNHVAATVPMLPRRHRNCPPPAPNSFNSNVNTKLPVSVGRPDGEELYYHYHYRTHRTANKPPPPVPPPSCFQNGDGDEEVRRTYLVPVPNRTVGDRRPVITSELSEPGINENGLALLPVVRVPAHQSRHPTLRDGRSCNWKREGCAGTFSGGRDHVNACDIRVVDKGPYHASDRDDDDGISITSTLTTSSGSGTEDRDDVIVHVTVGRTADRGPTVQTVRVGPGP